MAKYPFLIFTQDTPSYWHDFEAATSGDALDIADTICVSGDVYVKTEEDGSEQIIRTPGTAINQIRIFVP